jgi:hypothetical protein
MQLQKAHDLSNPSPRNSLPNRDSGLVHLGIGGQQVAPRPRGRTFLDARGRRDKIDSVQSMRLAWMPLERPA